MRRYSVRFLVAILTFAIGVTLSLILGLFKPAQVKVSPTREKRHDCPQKFRVFRPTSVKVTVDSELSDPVNLVYLGETPGHQLRFLVENRRDQVVSGYTINGTQIGLENGSVGESDLLLWGSDNVLRPGESISLTTLPQYVDGLSVRVSSVTFQSGFTWINPRETR